jgi:effector-binding domain-containing protein
LRKPGEFQRWPEENLMVRVRFASVLAGIGAAGVLLIGPATSPVSAQTAVQTETIDPFGQEVTLVPKTVVYLAGTATWDSAFDTLIDSLKTVYAYLDKAGIKPAGPAMTVYTSTDDSGFQFQAAVPVAEAPADLPKDKLALGKSPEGKVLKFVHRGTYDAMDTTYEAITNYLDDKGLDAKDLFIEEYVTDPVKTAEDKLVVNVFVPVK